MNFKFVRGGGGGGCDKQAQAQSFIASRPDSQTLTWSMVNTIKREIKRWKKEGEKWQWHREGLEPATWKMACYALTNWATKSFRNSMAEFEYLRLSCHEFSQSRHQGACDKCEAWGTGSVINMLQTWPSDLNLVKVRHWETKVRNKDGKLFMGKAKNDITVNIKSGATTVNIYFKFITCHDDSNIAKIEPQQPRIQPLSKYICTHFIIIYIYILCSYDIVLNKHISQSYG